MQIKIGDYVNGYRVEDVRKVDKKLHILITYMDEHHKPQSIWIVQEQVYSYMSKEFFSSNKIYINNQIGGI